MSHFRPALLAATSALALCLAAPARAAEIMPWGIILQGDSIRVGINAFGTFGNRFEFGSGINFDRTGTSTFDFSRDFLAPGMPHDNFSLSQGATLMVDNTNEQWYIDQNVLGTLSDFSGIARNGSTYDNRVVWQATLNDVAIEHDYFFNQDDLRVQIRTRITALTDLSDLYFARSVDPDATVEPGDTSTTLNTFGTQDGFTFVYGEATESGYLLGLLTDGAGSDGVMARSNNSWGFLSNFPTQAAGYDASYIGLDPYQLYTLPDSDARFTANGTASDDILALAFRLGDLATGDSVSFLYSYIFGNDITPFLQPDVNQPGTETSLAGTAALTRAALAQGMTALLRLTQQETQAILSAPTSGLTVSTKGEAAPNRLALRFGALTDDSGAGNLTVGSLTAAYQIDDRLSAGISYERADQTQTDQGFSTRADSDALAVYLRSRNAGGAGLTWKLAFGQSRGDITIDRAAGVVGAEAGTGSATLRVRAASAELGYGIRSGDRLLVSSYLRLTHATLTRGAYAEQATIAFPLTYHATTITRTTATLGLDVTIAAGPDTMVTLGAGVDHDLTLSDDAITGTSAIPGLATFTTDMTGPLDRTRAYLAASLRHDFGDDSSLLLTGQLGEDAYSTSLTKTVGLSYEIRF